jgi:hypothetical protein
MKKVLLFATPLLLFASGAPGQGLPALRDAVEALQARTAALESRVTGTQNSVTSLETRLNALESASADDETAAALVGTWSGSISSVELEQSMRFTGPATLPTTPPFFQIFGGVPAQTVASFAIPILVPGTNGGLDQGGAMHVRVNPEYWVARGGSEMLSFTLSRDGMKLFGDVRRDNAVLATLTGIVLGNNFFLLRARAANSGPCTSTGFVVFQGTGALSADHTRLLFTGTAFTQECKHEIFNVRLSKP